MKKILSVLLCLVMLAGLTAAAAETAEKTDLGSISVNGKFQLKAQMPEGYTVQVRQINSDLGYLQASITSEDTSKPRLMLTISYEDTDLSVLERLNDATAEQKKQIEDTFRYLDSVEISYSQTGLGTELMVVKEVEDATDFICIYTIYKGYGIEFVMEPGEGHEDAGLTDAQMQMCIDFLTNLDFVEVQ